MKYAILISINILLLFGVANAEIIASKHLSEGVSGEILVKGSGAFQHEGIYRIDDMSTSYHLYIVNTTRGVVVEAVPFNTRKD